jgi:hypothetical protein
MAKRAAKRQAADGWFPQATCRALDIDSPDDPLKLARIAVDENPLNKPFLPPELGEEVTPLKIALLTGKWWKPSRTEFTFAFLDSVAVGVPERIASFANVWNKHSAILFRWTRDVDAADVRIAFELDGYWSYLGTDNRSIPKSQPTMNLQGMNSLAFSEREGKRVIPHEFWHFLGGPHEHNRPEIVGRLDVQKTIRYFRRDQGWSEQTTRQQVLTPLSESAIFGTAPDQTSIACYWIPAECTKDGKPILGGSDLSEQDKAFAAKTWPKGGGVEPPPATDQVEVVVVRDGVRYAGKLPRAA